MIDTNFADIRVDSTIRRGDTFGKIMSAHLPDSTIMALFRQSRSSFFLNRIRQGQPYTISYVDSSFYRFRYEIDSKGIYEIEKRGSGYAAGVVLYKFDVDTQYVEGKIESTLLEAITEQGFPPLLAYEIANVFAWDVDFTYDVYKGDAFRVYFERLSRNGKDAGVGRILAAEFKDYSAVQFAYPDSDKVEYFSFDKRNVKKAFLKAPVEYSRTSGSFGGRFHPIQKRYKAHNGTDYAADRNTPVMAVADGKIVQRARGKYNGNYIQVRFQGGFSAFYLHLNKFGKYKKGQSVKQGDIVGYVGKTGLATGYHLCFQFRRHGKPYNFQRVKNPESAVLDSLYYTDFEENLNRFNFGESK